MNVYDFEEYKRRIDQALKPKGLTHQDFGTWDWRLRYDAGMAPVNAAREAMAAPMNVYGVAYDGCPACRMRLEAIGPIHGPELPPRAGIPPWEMTPREWAGDGPLKVWGS